MIPRILLIDMDGVLIMPGGYRKAMEATCRFFLAQAGLGDLAPGEDEYLCFEAQRVTSEWDMVPLSLLIAFNYLARNDKIPDWVSDLKSTITWLKQVYSAPNHLDYMPDIRRLGKFITPGVTAAEGILAVLEAGRDEALFPNIRNIELFRSLLSNTRKILECETTRKFQEYVLGKDVFVEIYQSNPIEAVESYLLRHDWTILNERMRADLITAIEQKDIYPAIYTARPSLPPKEVGQRFNGYSPEAELGLQLVGLEALPLIGYGKLGYLVNEIGGTIPQLIKPSAGQAMAAIAAAWSGQEWNSLLWAADILKGKINNPFHLPTEFDLFVIEDSPAGIQGGREAVGRLQSNGWMIHYTPLGIFGSHDKTSALQASGARMFADVNAALANILKQGN